jgi:serine/threonine protein kinase
MNRELSANTTLSHYRILSKIGAGGMGEVYLAQDTKLDRKVAIKFLNEEFSKDADKLSRFVQEAKAASALNHPNILTIHEIGEVDGKNYIATELIDGKTLREHLSQKETLQLNAILKIGVQVSEALSAAHQAGIIHRDIKPENIMLRKDGYAKVLDFGLAKLSEPRANRGPQAGNPLGVVAATGLAGSEDATRVQVNTTPGIVMGTVSYMSPEQARGKETDARTLHRRNHQSHHCLDPRKGTAAAGKRAGRIAADRPQVDDERCGHAVPDGPRPVDRSEELAPRVGPPGRA